MKGGLRFSLVLLGAALVLAACNGNDVDVPDEVAPGEADVQVTGTDALAFQPAEVGASPGEITVELTSEASANHTFTVEVDPANGAPDLTVVSAGPGETQSGTVDLEPGSYIFYCEVPGHRDAGMEGTIDVA